jgi:ParB-like chromosome segregation protein Spo0J
MLLKPVAVPTAQIYVPQRLRGTLKSERVAALAEDILENGQKTPIQVRRDTDRYVLVAGLHRLEAMRALGESTIEALIVQARKW